MVIDENTIGIWFMNLSATSDWMGHLYLEEGRPHLRYRFRYYDPADPSNDPFSYKDSKSWWSASFNGTKEEAIHTVRQLVRELESQSGNKCDELLMRDGNVKRFFNALSRKMWAHLKTP